jgi:5-methylcytosine-specific restriction protein A
MRRNFRQRGYVGGWDALAADFRARFPFCIGCWAIGLEVPTEVVDHIVPLASDRQGLLDPNNLQPACKWHHDVIKRTLEL